MCFVGRSWAPATLTSWFTSTRSTTYSCSFCRSFCSPFSTRVSSPSIVDFAAKGSRCAVSQAQAPGNCFMSDFHRHVYVSIFVHVAVTVTVFVTVSVKTCPYLPLMPLLLGRVRGNSAAGPGGRAPTFPRKRVDGAPDILAAYERQILKNRTRSYMNG